MAYEARVECDSINEAGDRLTTMVVTFPRIVLAEFNTHRVFSRNSASSRAIPIEKQMERIKQDPFVPDYWGRNQKGMQAEAELDRESAERAYKEWIRARDNAVEQAERLLETGVHKQLSNRLLEPFMWHTVVVTATEWNNFFALRANPMAQPEIQTIARMMKDLYESSRPELVRTGEWHMPLVRPDESDLVREQPEMMRKVSAGRCARVSYLTHDGVRDVEKDLELYERLASSGHMSPLEHVATPAVSPSFDYSADNPVSFKSAGFIGNFRGWKQLRKFMPNEDDFSKSSD